METFLLVLELIGTVSFAASGALKGIKKGMDLLGVCVLGVVTACGGGVLRDCIIGAVPPVMFREPVYALTAIGVSLVVFFPAVHRLMERHTHGYEAFMLIFDSVGLGVFATAGVSAAMAAGYGNNFFFVLFLGTITGVGGGVLRDVLSNSLPYIFTKHFYACAAMIGAALCALLWPYLGQRASMIAGAAVVFLLRLLAAKYRWKLPRAKK
jgi:uncharacterized membrane protein YeiH